MRRHVVKKQKHVPISRAHSFIETVYPVLEQLGCHPAFWNAAVVDAKLGIALSSETPWLVARSDEEQRTLERAVCVARNGNRYALILLFLTENCAAEMDRFGAVQ
uniref:AlNc14C52G4083 protein n=1 Tax=Albugo laibachii Nc14 TaxID=890382 RepID=F0WBP1_9STRA|nr:AlNc14C52G4083 [Albugo laibachii Nc14]|eukprot:CCA18568.1 AlNc14C52G4083 [Albugo laibachii Nc14]